MPHLDDVLERLITDAGFRQALEQDPERALAGYPLTPEERSVLDATVSGSRRGHRARDDGGSPVEVGHGRDSRRDRRVGPAAAASSQRGGDLSRWPVPSTTQLPDTGVGPSDGDEAGIIIIGGKPGEDVGFNPQPDPPIDADEAGIIIYGKPGEAEGFNPQPDPPIGRGGGVR